MSAITVVDVLALAMSVGSLLCAVYLVPVCGFSRADSYGLDQALWRALGGCLGILWITSLAWLWVRTAAMSGNTLPDALPVIPIVLFQSHFGSVWWLRVIAMIWASAAWLAGRASGGRWRTAAYAALFGLAWVAASRSAAGHAAAAGDWTPRELVDWLHVMSISVWGGSLVATVVLMFPRLSRTSAIGRARFAQRFSRIAGLALGGVLASGIYNALSVLPTVSALWTSPYGRTLGLKLLLVLGMIVCGAANRYMFVPELGTAARAGSPVLMPLRRLWCSVAVETLLLIGVLVVTSRLIQMAPPH